MENDSIAELEELVLDSLRAKGNIDFVMLHMEAPKRRANVPGVPAVYFTWEDSVSNMVHVIKISRGGVHQIQKFRTCCTGINQAIDYARFYRNSLDSNRIEPNRRVSTYSLLGSALITPVRVMDDGRTTGGDTIALAGDSILFSPFSSLNFYPERNLGVFVEGQYYEQNLYYFPQLSGQLTALKETPEASDFYERNLNNPWFHLYNLMCMNIYQMELQMEFE
ncbi:MAG: hypothetical protein HWE14_13360 [Flavobacteriia bacterium]|nr:hypothetical protein [Flavobacteriia bacterium]